MRLAFAVAAHLESEILIVDEVLAVGDAEFQKKCLGKMGEVSKGEGRTVLFVSHNMGAVSNLCNTGMLLNFGELTTYRSFESLFANYNLSFDIKNNFNTYEDEVMIIRNLPFLTNHDGLIQKCFTTCDKIIINLSLELKFDPIRGFRFGFDLYNNEGQVVFRSFHDDLKSYIFKKGLNELQITIPNYLLKQGDYVINIISGIHNAKWLLTDSISLQLNIINNQGLNSEYNDYRPGNIIPLIKYE